MSTTLILPPPRIFRPSYDPVWGLVPTKFWQIHLPYNSNKGSKLWRIHRLVSNSLSPPAVFEIASVGPTSRSWRDILTGTFGVESSVLHCHFFFSFFLSFFFSFSIWEPASTYVVPAAHCFLEDRLVARRFSRQFDRIFFCQIGPYFGHFLHQKSKYCEL